MCKYDTIDKTTCGLNILHFILHFIEAFKIWETCIFMWKEAKQSYEGARISMYALIQDDTIIF